MERESERERGWKLSTEEDRKINIPNRLAKSGRQEVSLTYLEL